MNFEQLGLNKKLLQAVTELGYTSPTEIQKEAIPQLIDSQTDFIGQAQTGTGKTAAFVLPLLQRLSHEKRNIQSLIITPTRELAGQISEEIQKLGKFEKFKSVVVYGGASYDRQISSIKKERPQIIVGTPGRIIDLINKRVLDFSKSDYLILDEADEMLKMGFFEDVQMILKSFNDKRRIWMFSATMPESIIKLVKHEFENPYIIKIKNKTQSNADIEQRYYLVQFKQRQEALYRLISVEDDLYAMIFCRTRAETKDLTTTLIDRGIKADCLNGDMGQTQREHIMSRFKAKKVRLLVCTDVAARGIDVNDLTHVFNYGLPQDAESYIHRIGRTGRAGKKGMAISIIDPRERSDLRRIEYILRSRVNKCELPTIKDLKNSLVQNKLSRMNPITESVTTKSDDYVVDSSFSLYTDYFKNISKEEMEKIMFTYMFNRELRRLNDQGELSAVTPKRIGYSRRRRSDQRNFDTRDRRRNKFRKYKA